MIRLHLCIRFLLLAATASVGLADERLSGVDRAFFENRIRPALVKHCYECHSAKAKEVGGGLLLDSRAGLLKGGQSGPAIVANKPADSLLVHALRYDGLEMPPEAPLPEPVIRDVVEWISRGAGYPHDPSATSTTDAPEAPSFDGKSVWSFRPRTNPEPPAVSAMSWPVDPLDRFVLAEIENARQSPVADAPAQTLIRRLYYDLTGLPPSYEEVQVFVRSCQQDRRRAIEDLVDSLLASPQYGERWGRHWLDLARYAESNGDDGLGRNATFPHAWRYRDYVIDAFARDTPYDRFVTEQIAGDLLPADDAETRNRQLIATGFLAIGPKPAAAMNNNFAMDVVDNQIHAVTTTILGLSVSCARCHDHKHDPIPTRDYYALAGIFTSTETLYGLAANEKLTAPPTPLHELTSQWPRRQQKPTQDRLALPDTWDGAVKKLHPAFYARLNAPHKQLKATDVNGYSAETLAKVSNAKIHGQLETVTDSYTVSFWFRNDTPNNKRPITAYLFSRAALGDKALPGDHIGIGGTHDPTRTGRLFVFNGNTKKTSIGGSTVIRPGSWNHVTLIRSGDSVKLLLNGNVEIDETLEASYGTSTQYCLGARSDQFAPLVGHVGEFAVWESAIATNQAQTLYDQSGRARGVRSKGLAMGVRDRAKVADCKIHIGGQSAKKGPGVPRGFLTAYTAVCGEDNLSPRHTPASDRSGRLELATWLTDPSHPQTARVMVNRIWLHLFGRGLVTTPDDFGVYGARPTHPALLDYLANRFVANEWSVKAMIREIVLSRTYQLDSRCSSALYQTDPDNRLYARHTRRRLDAESLRDSVLHAAGTLNLNRPEGSVIQSVEQLINWPPGEATSFHQLSQHRSIYLCMLRHSPPPELSAFDLPDGVAEAGQRAETISPMQSLFLLNNPLLIRESKMLAESVVADNQDRAERARQVFRRILGRNPTPSEIEGAREYVAEFQSGQANQAAENTELKAWSSLCQAVFATNEFQYID